MTDLNFKKGEYRNATAPSLFNEGDIVIARLLQPQYRNIGFTNKDGCLPRADVLCLRTEDDYTPDGRKSCLSTIMPGPGIGFLTGVGMSVRPIYTMPQFTMEDNGDGFNINMELFVHDGVTDGIEGFASSPYSGVNFPLGVIPAAAFNTTVNNGSEIINKISAGIMTVGAQTFLGNKIFRNVINSSPNFSNCGGITLYNNLAASGYKISEHEQAPQIGFYWNSVNSGKKGKILLNKNQQFIFLRDSDKRSDIDGNLITS